MEQELLNRIRKCEGLPTLPSIAVQVLELVRDPRSEIPQLARLISKDPALASKILRTANSSIYCMPRKVSKLTRALSLLGLQTVRVLVLGFSLARNLKNYRNKGFRPLDYWRRAIYSAAAALTLAQRIHLELQEEAFVAALLMDLGMLVLDDVMGEQYGQINEKARTHNELAKLEESLLQTTHARVSEMMAESWGFPPALTIPMGAHHNPTSVQDRTLKQLAQVCYLAGRCADVFVEESAAHAISELREYCLIEYGMTDADCDALLNQISRRTGEIAPLFDVSVNAGVSFEDILKKANDSIVQMTLASQQQIQRAKRQMEEQVWLDPLTRMANRRRFDAVLLEKLASVDAMASTISLVIIQVNGLQPTIREHGSIGGDAVVRQAAKVVQASARPDSLAARFGDDSMALLLPAVGRTEAMAIAEAIRREAYSKPVDFGRVTLPLTITAGVASVDPATPFKDPAHLVKAAQLALDAANAAGSNCVRAFSRGKPSAAA